MMTPSRPHSSTTPAATDGKPALYTARVDNIRGTSGQVRIQDGPAALAAGAEVDDLPAGAAPAPEVTLPTGGPMAPARGYNPEQFLAMAWSTCLGETLRVVLAERGLPHRSRVSVEVELHSDPAGGYRFAPRAEVTIEQMAADEAEPLVAAAHARCPVSKLLTGRGSAVVELMGADAQS
ncbi:OsmC family protein [Brachybacterium sp. FME24]|uniref:OsmC family protein n=1 Tax=Brachybacterium sp. FME24 TaxID=2742605 RepID=UPI0018696545|nr:OsmC family protein [Brachybacterium sp. FME24]